MTELKDQLEQTIAQTPILLFTKGNKMFPRCGFSAAVIDVFNRMQVPFETIDIFEDPEIKPTLVSITDWPTTPQIFIGGEFVGGGDIVREMYASGELQPLVEKALAEHGQGQGLDSPRTRVSETPAEPPAWHRKTEIPAFRLNW